jgi:hypothetical protein
MLRKYPSPMVSYFQVQLDYICDAALKQN